MFWIDMLLRSSVVNEPYYVLADGTANFIIYFNNYVIVTDVIVTRPDGYWGPFYLFFSLWFMMLL